MAVVTAITAQSTVGVLAVEPVAPALVERQIRGVLDDIGVDGIKIGMLGSAEIVSVVARCLASVGETVPVVLDPVLRSSSGASLLGPGGVEVLVAELLPRVTVITPNRAEAAVLLGRSGLGTEDEAVAAARALALMGAAAMITGGDAGGAEVVDVLAEAAGPVTILRAPRLHSRSTHGTGCTLSSALAANLASGLGLPAAVRAAIEFVRGAMDPGLDLGRGRAPLDHGAARRG
jgi:hydroxymethylpyrimidine/phosphomethylpyrimidine kinase